MALSDPELDLLCEMLEEDPGSEVFLQVGEELVRRGRWSDAVDVLANGLARTEEDDTEAGYALLARAALESGNYPIALEAVAALHIDPRQRPDLARIEILALERSGRLEAAKSAAERFLRHDPSDVVVTSVIERLAAPPPARGLRASDPFYTVERAEAYVDLGRYDRALRIYRRILLANPNNLALELRTRQLLSSPAGVPDDLSSELTDPGLVPAEPDASDTPAPVPIAMPEPRRTPGVPERSGEGQGSGPSRSVSDDEGTEQTEILAALRAYALSGSAASEPSGADKAPSGSSGAGPSSHSEARPPDRPDLDLLQGTETDWASTDDRPNRRLLRR